MAENNEDRRVTARRKAQNHFAASEQRDQQLRRELETERAKDAAKRERLRALRLAKEAEDAQILASKPAPEKKSSSRGKRIIQG